MTPFQILLPFTGGLFMIATINFGHNAWSTFWAIAEEGFGKKMKNAQYQRDRDATVNSIFINIYRALLCGMAAVAIWWLTGYLFD